MLSHFSLAHYQLTLEALEPLELPPFKGSALRGGFGHAFKRLVCFEPKSCRQACTRPEQCPYGYVFETPPPPDAEKLRNFQAVSHPFVIVPPADRQTHYAAGELLQFKLTLVGRGVKYLPYFLLVFKELGKIGLGRKRGRYVLQALDALIPYQRRRERIYRAEDDLVHTPESVITGHMVMAYAESLPTGQLTLTFLTPIRLKYRGNWVREGPPFQALLQTLLGRASALSYFHCGQPLMADFRGLIDQAAEVSITECQTSWQAWGRFSGRQKQRIPMGGLVGEVTYEGDLRPYLPLLALGELVHVGKGNVFGNGLYTIGQK